MERVGDIQGVSLTAMLDRTICNWKKTRAPSSGHSVFTSSLAIPSRVEPLRPPRQRTVLPGKKNTTHWEIPSFWESFSEMEPCSCCQAMLPGGWRSHSHPAEVLVFQPHLHLRRPGTLGQHNRTSSLLRILDQSRVINRNTWTGSMGTRLWSSCLQPSQCSQLPEPQM